MATQRAAVQRKPRTPAGGTTRSHPTEMATPTAPRRAPAAGPPRAPQLILCHGRLRTLMGTRPRRPARPLPPPPRALAPQRMHAPHLSTPPARAATRSPPRAPPPSPDLRRCEVFCMHTDSPGSAHQAGCGSYFVPDTSRRAKKQRTNAGKTKERTCRRKEEQKIFFFFPQVCAFVAIVIVRGF